MPDTIVETFAAGYRNDLVDSPGQTTKRGIYLIYKSYLMSPSSNTALNPLTHPL